MNIKIGHFCGLSSATDFRSWLKTTALDLYDELINHPIKGCKSKQEKMVVIKDKLYERGQGSELETFIKKRYPYMIVEDKLDTQPTLQKPRPARTIVAEPEVSDHIEVINKHKVFKRYRPDLLTFPQKYIIIGNKDKLPELIKEFAADKVGVDYIIIDDHAYIEYFKRKYSDVSEKIKPESREIWVYKQRVKQNVPIH